MCVTVLMINDAGVLIRPLFFKTIISTVISPVALLLLVSTSVDNIKFLNEDDSSAAPPGCHSAVLFIIALRFACLFS